MIMYNSQCMECFHYTVCYKKHSNVVNICPDYCKVNYLNWSCDITTFNTIPKESLISALGQELGKYLDRSKLVDWRVDSTFPNIPSVIATIPIMKTNPTSSIDDTKLEINTSKEYREIIMRFEK